MEVINRRAKFDYQILDKFEAGIVLTGAEVKAIRKGKVSINSAYAKITEGEIFLINSDISVENVPEYNSRRNRKLLLNRKEIERISAESKAKKLTLVPTRLYNVGPLFKIELALAKPKKQYQKKEVKKRRDVERDVERELLGRDEKLEHRNSRD